MANNINISSVISPDILKNISQSTAIKTFGDQIKDQTKEKIISVDIGKQQQLQDQINEVIALETKVRLDHNDELKRLETLFKENQITKEQYDEAVAKENISFEEKLKDLEQLKIKLQNDLKNILADPYNKIKQKANERKLRRAKRKARTKAEKTKARRDKAKKIAQNAAKTLAPVLALQIANKFTSIISQRQKLEILVDQVNAYIDTTQTPDQVTIATNLRNNTITLINNSINKLTNLQKTINQINKYITIFNAIITVISSIPIPTSVPPGVGIPVSLIIKLVKTLEKAQKLISALNIVLSISLIALENEINELNELIKRLKNINIDNLNQQQLSNLQNFFLPTGGEFGVYKGFRFQIKEEQNQAFVVKGNKRRYAVAINRDGVETLKSEYSFTLDPNDLVDQLKLIIDQRNLQG